MMLETDQNDRAGLVKVSAESEKNPYKVICQYIATKEVNDA
jgi:hypothetical protein